MHNRKGILNFYTVSACFYFIKIHTKMAEVSQVKIERFICLLVLMYNNTTAFSFIYSLNVDLFYLLIKTHGR